MAFSSPSPPTRATKPALRYDKKHLATASRLDRFLTLASASQREFGFNAVPERRAPIFEVQNASQLRVVSN
uniref:Uncharacterized protein n=1 Tax=Mycena chlorophos TaxID=658473 RepID=A0ABQ0LTU6_MYCCL|nr:predicted protein [Mycena chlorophos]